MPFQRGIRPLTMAQQELAMGRHQSAFIRTRRHPWVWRGLVRASEHGQTYVIDMDVGHRSGSRVTVLVREPGLVPNEDTGRPPHSFEDGSLCISDRLASAFEFHADTTVPWIYSWFYFYERWLETGIWFGPQAEGHEIGAVKPVEPEPHSPIAEGTRPPTRGEAA